MNKIRFNLFPEGKDRCLTMSYDDGQYHDCRLLEIFNRYGIRGTFHLNSGRSQTVLDPNLDLTELYAGHEISVHTVNHPFPQHLPEQALLEEILEDKRALERRTGAIIRGMSYPFGTYTPKVIEVARNSGMEYSRTIQPTRQFDLPKDFMEWHPTCHHNHGILELADAFFAKEKYSFPRMRLFYVWGHSYEFPRDDNWSMIEEFCAKLGGREDVWYATSIEIVDYIQAMRSLRFNADCDRAYNPSVVDVWFTANDEKICCKAGQSVVF